MKRAGWAALLVAVAALAAACTPVGPGGSLQPTDCAHWRYGVNDEPAPGSLPTEFDRHSYKHASERDPDPRLFGSPHNQCGQKGPALDLALGVTQGRDDVRIAVPDSGTKWRDAGSMNDLATRAYVTLGEARPPCVAQHPDGDCDGD